ncbi:MAG TPA: histidine ammonia-lyase [bacterium]|nr:histidine ammonia-lyase [bacterium]
MVVKIDGNNLTIEEVHEVARNHAKVVLTEGARRAVRRCRRTVEDLVREGQMIYGVTTGIGELARVRVSPEMGKELQRRIVYSHSAGVGQFFEEDEVRAGMLLRANVIAKGYSAVRLSTLETLIAMINRNLIPAVNEKGSVGTSGDLSPLSQVAEVVMGEGRAFYKGRLMSGKEAMARAGIKPVVLSFKEGLGLINGSQMFTGCGALRLYDAYRVFKTAMIASAMSADALRTPPRAFDKRAHQVRPFNGQNTVAANLRRLLKGSKLASGGGKVQDAYSLRCIPQIYGPTLDALHYIRQQIEIEMNSAADNPLFFAADREQVACGNFHGQPVALVLDLLAIAMSEVGGLSERHINRLMNPHLNVGLPGFLVKGEGLNSGLMVAQYTAASLCSENKLLSHPAIVDNFSMAADQEDHVCMGPIAARKAKEIIWNVINVLAIEMMSAAQAMDYREETPGVGPLAAYKEIRKVVKPLKKDRVMYHDIQAIARKITSWDILDAVEAEVGKLDLTWKMR